MYEKFVRKMLMKLTIGRMYSSTVFLKLMFVQKMLKEFFSDKRWKLTMKAEWSSPAF